MNRDQIISFIQNRLQREVTPPPKFGTNLVRTAVGQGFLYGFGDEAEAYVRSVLGEETYSQNLEQIRNEIKIFRKNNPRTAISSEILGSLPTSFAGAVALGKLGLKSPVLVAGLEGFTYGFGTGENDAKDRATQGAVSSALAAGLTKFIGKVSATPEAEMLIDRGVRLTPGQTLGGAAKKLEDASTSVPLGGSAVTDKQLRARKDFNLASINQALEPLKDSIPSKRFIFDQSTAIPDAIEQATAFIDKAYKSALTDDLSLVNARTVLDSIEENVENLVLTENAQKIVNKQIKKVISPRIRNGELKGAEIKSIDEDLGKLITNFGKGTSGSREVAQALKEIKSIFRNELLVQNPTASKQLRDADRAYRNMMPILRATVSAAKNDGVFTPNMLMQGIKSSDLTKRKINVAKGQAPLQDLAVAGQRTIGETLPESGTASRLLASGGLLGYGIGIDPFVATTVPLVQRGLYSDLGQNFLNRIMRNSNLLSLATPSVGGQSNVEEGLLGQTVPLY